MRPADPPRCAFCRVPEFYCARASWPTQDAIPFGRVHVFKFVLRDRLLLVSSSLRVVRIRLQRTNRSSFPPTGWRPRPRGRVCRDVPRDAVVVVVVVRCRCAARVWRWPSAMPTCSSGAVRAASARWRPTCWTASTRSISGLCALIRLRAG